MLDGEDEGELCWKKVDLGDLKNVDVLFFSYVFLFNFFLNLCWFKLKEDKVVDILDLEVVEDFMGF